MRIEKEQAEEVRFKPTPTSLEHKAKRMVRQIRDWSIYKTPIVTNQSRRDYYIEALDIYNDLRKQGREELASQIFAPLMKGYSA